MKKRGVFKNKCFVCAVARVVEQHRRCCLLFVMFVCMYECMYVVMYGNTEGVDCDVCMYVCCDV